MKANADLIAELENWLINAFNGEWLKTAHPVPIDKRAISMPGVPVL